MKIPVDSATLAWLGWPGVAAVVVAFVGQLVTAHAVARWVFGHAPSFGRRVMAAGVVAVGLWIVGVVAWSGLALPLWAVQALRGGACGVMLGLAAVLSSRSLEGRAAHTPTEMSHPPAVTVNPPGVRRFQAAVIGGTAVGFVSVGLAMIAVAIGERSAVLGGVGTVAVLVGLGLAGLTRRVWRGGESRNR